MKNKGKYIIKVFDEYQNPVTRTIITSKKKKKKLDEYLREKFGW